jgi:hypothetical protein
MLTDISERQISDVHPMNDQRSRDSQDVCRVVRTDFLLLGEHGDAFALKKMDERSLMQSRSLRRQLDDLILADLRRTRTST